MLLQQQIEDEAARGLIRKVKAEHLLVNIISMCIFPFVARPIVQNLFDMNDEEYRKYLLSRESEIIDFVLKSISI